MSSGTAAVTSPAPARCAARHTSAGAPAIPREPPTTRRRPYVPLLDSAARRGKRAATSRTATASRTAASEGSTNPRSATAIRPQRAAGPVRDVAGLRPSERHGQVGPHRRHPGVRLVRGEAGRQVHGDDERPARRREGDGPRGQALGRHPPLEPRPEERVHGQRRDGERLELARVVHLADRAADLLEAVVRLPRVRREVLRVAEEERLDARGEASRHEEARDLEAVAAVVARAGEDDDARAEGRPPREDAGDLPRDRVRGALHQDEAGRPGGDRPHVECAGLVRRDDPHGPLRARRSETARRVEEQEREFGFLER